MAGQTSVKPISVPTIAWGDFIKRIAELTGRSPTFGVDEYPYKLSEYARYLAILGEFRFGKKQNPIQTIQNAEDLLDHLHFSFLISGPASLIFDIMERTDLEIVMTRIKGGRSAIVTGSLNQWKSAVVRILTGKAKPEICSVFSYCFNFFKFLGLQEIWNDYRIKPQADKDILLLEHK